MALEQVVTARNGLYNIFIPAMESSRFAAPHRRRNPLTGDWVLVSPQRTQRPWLGQVEKNEPDSLPAHDPGCYLCPGNARAGGARNPAYAGTYVFDNDFPALLGESAPPAADPHPLFSLESESGVCRVVCFSPRHDLTLPELPSGGVEAVMETWRAESVQLSARSNIGYIQIFENKGAMMGCSNPHPHSQIWATAGIPNEPAQELASQSDYSARTGRTLLGDYLAEEHRRGERVLVPGAHFTALIPFWAVWPFEVLVVAHRPCANLADLRPEEMDSLAAVFREVTTRYDNLFGVSFPYSMGFHPAPNDGRSHPEWVLHAHFYPPLLRSATVRKFMVGYELMAMPQRDLTPEQAAERLRAVPAAHYRGGKP
jgi:UDPglucose--hexose-1-phosphate uridylyltransferase